MINSTYIISFFVTTIFFFFEAIIHYNIGKYGKIGFQFPKYTHILKIISTIFLFSFLSCCMTHYIQIAFNQTVVSLNSNTQGYFHN